MTYEEFKEAVRDGIAIQLGNSAQVYLKTITKMNDTKKDAVVIRESEEEMETMIYLDELYQTYRSYNGFDKCVKEIVRICRERPAVCQEDIPRTWEAAGPGIRMKVINKEWNREFLEQMPSVDYLNFAVIFCVALEEDGEVGASVSVTEDVMKRWGVTVDMLWRTAVDNIRKCSGLVQWIPSLKACAKVKD